MCVSIYVYMRVTVFFVFRHLWSSGGYWALVHQLATDTKAIWPLRSTSPLTLSPQLQDLLSLWCAMLTWLYRSLRLSLYFHVSPFFLFVVVNCLSLAFVLCNLLRQKCDSLFFMIRTFVFPVSLPSLSPLVLSSYFCCLFQFKS